MLSWGQQPRWELCGNSKRTGRKIKRRNLKRKRIKEFRRRRIRNSQSPASRTAVPLGRTQEPGRLGLGGAGTTGEEVPDAGDLKRPGEKKMTGGERRARAV